MYGSKLGLTMEGDVSRGGPVAMGVALRNTYRFVSRGAVKGADGRWRRKCKWVEEVKNLTVTEGLNNLLTNQFKGSAYTAAWYVGLIDNTGFSALNATDTAAKITTTTPSGGTNSWQENIGYSGGVRPTLTLGTASGGSIDNTASKAVFTASGTETIYGGFVVSSGTQGGTTGTIYGEAAFSATKSLTSGDTLTVTVTLTAATM